MKGGGSTALHAALWMLAATVTAGGFTLGTGMAGAALGALLGVMLGRRLAGTRLRTWALPALAAGLLVLALATASLLTRWPGPAALLGPRVLYALAEFLPAVALPLALVGTLEALALRHHAWRVAGLAVLAVLFSALFAAHQEGFLNRPYFLVDPLWGHGQDPLPWFLLLGLILVALLAAVLVGGSWGRRTLAGFALLLGALTLVFLALPRRHLKDVAELHRVRGDGPPDPAGQGGGGEAGAGQESGGKGSQASAPDFQDQVAPPTDGPVAVVVFHNDYAPPMGLYYFRETAFSAFNGVRLVQDQGQRFDRDLPGFGANPLAAPRGALVRTTVAIMAAHARPFGLVNPVTFRETGNPDPKRFFQAYDVVSRGCATHPRDLVRAPLGDAGWDAATRAHYTEGPPDPRYGALAARILEGLAPDLRGLPFAKALAIKLWMDRTTTYSRHTSHGDSPDPVADFLFGDLRGHCVYLAHAACLLYRSAGLPSRVAAGYAANPDFRYGGAALLLRGSNAHAWPEVYLEGQGWQPLDITPARSEDPPQEAPDRGLQQMLGEMAMEDKPPPIPPPEAGRPPLGERLAFLARVLGALLLALACLALPGALAVKLWRRSIPFHCAAGKVPRLAYRAALDAAAAHGLRRSYGETREAFALRAGSLPALAQLTAIHLRWALGRREEPPDPAPCLALLRATRAQLRAASTPTRRWLAGLDLLAWTRVR